MALEIDLDICDNGPYKGHKYTCHIFTCNGCTLPAGYCDCGFCSVDDVSAELLASTSLNPQNSSSS